MQSKSQPKTFLAQYTVLYLAVCLMMAFWLTRTIVITRFPPFIDEIFHINFGADDLKQGPLAHAEEGRQFTVWWYILFQSQENAPIATARLATVLVATLGAAALISLGRQFAGNWGMLVVAVLYTVSTYHTFFERLALADPISAACVALSLHFACRLARRVKLMDAAVMGLLLFIAVGAKISALPYLALPLFAALTLRSPDSTWHKRLKWLAVGLVVEGALTLAFLGLLIWRGYDPFFYLAPADVIQHNNIAIMAILARIPSNIGVILSLIVSYWGWFGLLLGVASLAYALMRRRWFLVVSFFLPLMVLWTSERQASRHLMFPLTLLLLSIALTIASLLQKPNMVIRVAILSGVAIWLLPIWIPFAGAYLANPAALSLSAADQHEYMSSEASGFGLAEVKDYLKQQPVTQVIGLFSTCTGLKWMTLEDFPVNCPRINPNGEDIDTLNRLMSDNRKAGVYVVFEELPYLPSNPPGKLIKVIQRPGDGLALSIYDLAP